MATTNVLNESWEAEKVFGVLQRLKRRVPLDELVEWTKLPPKTIVRACRDLRNAGLISGSGPWGVTMRGRRQRLDPNVYEVT